MFDKVLVVRKISALEYYYNGDHESVDLNESDAEQVTSLDKIKNILEDAGVEYKITTRRNLKEIAVNDYGLIVSAGGDGTVVATSAYNDNVPQLNIRLDKRSKGVLCHKDFEGALKTTLNGEFNIEKWTRQDVYLNGEFIGRALNETSIGENMDFSKMTKYYFGEEYCENSGLVVVTGTGSTGWPRAFDGYSRTSEMFRYRTILPAKGSEFGEKEKFTIKYRGHEGKFKIDGTLYNFPRDSTLEIKLSKNPLRVLG